jgi:two-component system, OmpR family, response regulator RstA
MVHQDGMAAIVANAVAAFFPLRVSVIVASVIECNEALMEQDIGSNPLQNGCILVVEDDHKLAGQIARFLQGYHYEVLLEARGDLAVERILQTQPDLVVLDLMLPGADGFEICRAVRTHYRGAILMLTASEDDMDHVAGIEIGADDYLIKPVHPRVLLAHIRLLLRRQAGATVPEAPTEENRHPPLKFGSLCIYPLPRRVELDQQEVLLTPAEFDVLLLLASRAEEIISRDDMLKTLRGIEYDGLDRSVDVKISALRRKLGDNLSQPRRIITVRAKGYLFVPDAW